MVPVTIPAKLTILKKDKLEAKGDLVLADEKVKVSKELVEFVKKHKGQLVKVGDNEYLPRGLLNDQDLHDINEIKDYEQMAEVRIK